jgi:hypothetical protein
MVSASVTALGPGVIVEGEKLQVALVGNEVCKQESVTEYLGFPVI